MVYIRQSYVLLRRNLILLWRHWPSLLAQVVLAPFFFLLLLYILAESFMDRQRPYVPHPESVALYQDPIMCQGRVPGRPCISLMVYPDTEDVRSVITSMGRSIDVPSPSIINSLAPPDDQYDAVMVPDEFFVPRYVETNTNTTLLGITFKIDESQIEYHIWYNATLFQSGSQSSDFFNTALLSFENQVENAVLQTFAPDMPILQPSIRPFPTLKLERVVNGLASSLAPTILFCATMVPIVIMLNQIVAEKQARLRSSLMMIGCSIESWYTSYFLTYAFTTGLTCFMATALGEIFGFEFFRYANFGVVFFTFWIHALSEIAFAFFSSVFIRQASSAVLYATFWYIIGLLFMSVLFASSFVGYVWWSTTMSPLGWQLLWILPFWNFGVIMISIASYTAGDVNSLTQQYVPPQGFGWRDLVRPVDRDLIIQNNVFPPPPIYSWGFMVANMLMYILLAWYLDSVLPDEFGNRKPFFFFASRGYWGFKKRDESPKDIKDWLKTIKPAVTTQRPPEFNDEGAQMLEEAALNPDCQPKPMLRVAHFNKHWGKKKNKKVAVQDSSFVVQEGELLAILGSNGAGKSTTVNMLCGNIPVTSGGALLNDSTSILHDSRSRGCEYLSLCPQHDLLFDDLTPTEHIRLFSGIRNVPFKEALEQGMDRIKRIGLWHRKDSRVGDFSGGMKRRLSLVISTLGDPKVLVCDEVSTGLDPVAFRILWKFIEYYKKDRVIIWVTHNIAECEYLADNIMVMRDGWIVASGNTLELKRRYGRGYFLNVNIRADEEVDEADLDYSKETRPPVQTQLEDVSGNSVRWNIKDAADLAAAIQWTEDQRKSSLVPINESEESEEEGEDSHEDSGHLAVRHSRGDSLSHRNLSHGDRRPSDKRLSERRASRRLSTQTGERRRSTVVSWDISSTGLEQVFHTLSAATPNVASEKS